MFYFTVLSQLKYASEVASKNMIITYWILFDTPIPHIMYTLLSMIIFGFFHAKHSSPAGCNHPLFYPYNICLTTVSEGIAPFSLS